MLGNSGSQTQSAMPHRRLQRFEIECFNGLASHQSFDLVEQFGVQGLGERRFF